MARALMCVTLCPPCKEIGGLAVKGLLGASSHGGHEPGDRGGFVTQGSTPPAATTIDHRAESASSVLAACRSDSGTRISRGPAAVKSSSGESIASVSRYVQSMPAERSRPQTTSASGPSDTTVNTTPSSGSMPGGYPTGIAPYDEDP